MTAAAQKPLAGVRVLDLTNVLAGPFCCHQLAHLGAEVIKVEAPGRGDLARQLGADEDLSAADLGVSFLAQNAGKRSITLNLKSDAGRTVFLKLVGDSQVVVENFRPGVMDRLQLGFERLKTVNESLIYCAISGFGQDGPLRDLPAYDQIIQGMSGIMSITGDAETAPYRVGYPVCDTIGGLTAAMAIGAALAGRPRQPATFIDVSMLEATLATMGWVVSNWLIAGQAPAPHGNENVTSAPSGTFQAADGLLNIAANKQEQWEMLCRHLGREDLLRHPDYVTREGRKRHRAALRAALEETLQSRPAGKWAEELAALGVPAGPVLAVPDVLEHPQIAGRGMIAEFAHPKRAEGRLRLLRPGMKINGQAPAVETPPPILGADSEAILKELGYDDTEIEALKREGAL